ncbi:hypothetical protein BASA81_013761 [Batrachochytrium salamandrivorans]|nr:hypothetical protein BASA81_013761 [Batrachochytrium salamandrivorans]
MECACTTSPVALYCPSLAHTNCSCVPVFSDSCNATSSSSSPISVIILAVPLLLCVLVVINNLRLLLLVYCAVPQALKMNFAMQLYWILWVCLGMFLLASVAALLVNLVSSNEQQVMLQVVLIVRFLSLAVLVFAEVQLLQVFVRFTQMKIITNHASQAKKRLGRSFAVFAAMVVLYFACPPPIAAWIEPCLVLAVNLIVGFSPLVLLVKSTRRGGGIQVHDPWRQGLGEMVWCTNRFSKVALAQSTRAAKTISRSTRWRANSVGEVTATVVTDGGVRLPKKSLLSTAPVEVQSAEFFERALNMGGNLVLTGVPLFAVAALFWVSTDDGVMPNPGFSLPALFFALTGMFQLAQIHCMFAFTQHVYKKKLGVQRRSTKSKSLLMSFSTGPGTPQPQQPHLSPATSSLERPSRPSSLKLSSLSASFKKLDTTSTSPQQTLPRFSRLQQQLQYQGEI